MMADLRVSTERFRRAMETFAEAVTDATSAVRSWEAPLELFRILFVDLERSTVAYEDAAKLVAARYNASHRYRMMSWRRLNRPMRLEALRLAEMTTARCDERAVVSGDGPGHMDRDPGRP